MEWLAVAGFLVTIGALAVAGGGLVVAQRTLKLTEAERTAGFRQALYDAQARAMVELSVEVSSFCVDANMAIGKALKTRPGALNDAERKAVHVLIGDRFEKLSTLFFRYYAILPKNVVDALNTLLDGYSGIVALTPERAKWPSEYVTDPDPQKRMRIVGTDVIKAMRAALGTDPLTQQTLDRIGQPRP